jgi:glycosyltransferase involved in cell wall biosynthesis
MKKKALFVATIYGFLNSFESNNMRILKELGYEVHCIANPYEDLIPGHAKVKTPNIDAVGGVIKHGWRCARSPYDKNNIVALRQLKALLKKENFDLVHCHTPMGGVLARIACEPYRKKGMKVIYTAHGFHFYDGAPKKNWLIYYPIEKELSRITDVLINITLEDYNRARKEFHAGHTYYVPGVGVDLDKFKSNVDIANVRETIGVPNDSTWLLSVGELNDNKNHENVIRAISQIHNPLIFYTIAGEGPKREYLEKLIQELGLQKQVRLLGYCSDVNDLYHAADIYIHPSLREGLSVATMEAMACGLPIIEGKIRGNVDLVDENGGILYNPASVEECVSSVKRGLALTTADRESMGGHNQTKIQGFGRKTVEDKMREIYSQVSCVTDNAM